MSYKLLLADDSVTIQRVIALTFADEDVDVIAVGDGEQAIARVQTDRPDIVLADVGMPKRSGYDVAAFIKSHAALSHIPVLLLTSAFERIDEERLRQAGCEGVLVKPFEPRHVIARVRELLHLHGSPRSMQSMADAPQSMDRHGSSSSSLRPVSAGKPAPSLQSEPGTARALEDFYDRLAVAFAGRAPARGAMPFTTPEPPADAQPPDTPATNVTKPPAAADPTSRPTQAKTTADAFAALRAVEQGEPGALPLRLTIGEASVAVNDELIDTIVTRVVQRLAPDVVRDVVIDVVSEMAERLIREEIERIRKRT